LLDDGLVIIPPFRREGRPRSLLASAGGIGFKIGG
jgi:hypothetical protein